MAADSTVRVVFLGSSGGAVRATQAVTGSLGGLARTASLVSKALAVGVVGGLAAAVKAAVSFDKELRNINTISKLSETQLKSLGKQLLSLARESGKAPTDLAKGMYQIVSSGFAANDAIKVLTVSSKAATAGLTDTTTATKAVVSVLNAYHLNANEAGKVSDILFKTVERGVLSFEELASQIGDVLPIAAQLGVPLEDIGGAMATITLHGVNAAEASTQLKSVLVGILKPSDDLKRTIHDMGFETGEMALKTLGLEGFMRKLTTAAHGSGAAFADWFPNVRAMSGALNIAGKNVETLHQNIDAMRSSQGAAGDAFAEQGKSISVMWGRAKAALIAAAIPVGQLLFPALEGAAEKVGAFAMSIQSHMPQIRAAFGEISGLIGGVGSAFGDIASTTGGQSAIVGILTSLAAAKGITGTKGIIQGIGGAMRALGPAGTVAAVGVGVLTAAWFAASRQGGLFEGQLRDIDDAINKRNAATRAHAQVLRALGQAQVNVETSTLQLEGAERLYSRSVQESGKRSLEARQALAAVHQAKQQVRQSTADLTAAEQLEKQTRAAVATTTKDVSGGMRKLQTDAENLRSKYQGLVAEQDRLSAAGSRGADSQRRFSLELLKQGVIDAYAERIAHAARSTGVGAAKSLAYAAAVRTLANDVDGLPDFKTVTIYVNTHHTENIKQIVSRAIARSPVRGTIPGAGGRLRPPGRALGGFIPGPVGAAVPIIAHAGEVVLNKAQQHALGGPRLLASMFGFTGDEGPGFASGGFVKKVPPKPSRAHGRKRDYKALTDIARAALRGVSAIDAREASMDTNFQQTVRQFNISQENYFRPENVPLVYGSSAAAILAEVPGQIPTTVTYRGPTSGFETRDPSIQPGDPVLNEFGEPQFTEVQVLDLPQIQQRLREIATLIRMRQNMVGALDDEKEALEAALAAIDKAIEELRAEIKREIAAAQEEAKRIRELKAEIAGKRRQIAGEQRKKRPNRKTISRLNAEISGMERDVGSHEKARDSHTGKATKLKAVVDGLIGDKARARPNLGAIPTDKRNVELDIAELQTERSDIRSLKSEVPTTEQIPAAPAAAGGDGGAEDGGGGDGGGGGDAGAGSPTGESELVKALREMIGKLRLALGIQEVQLGVLGNFAVGGFVSGVRGSPSLNLLHGGEVVLNPAQQGVLGGPERIARIFGFQRFARGGFVDGPLMSDPGGGGPPPPPPTGGGPPSGNQGLPPPTQTIDIPGSLVGSFGGGGAPRLNVQSVVRTDSTTRRGGDSVVVNVPPPQGARISVTNQARDEALKQFLDKAIDTRIEQVHLPAFGRTLAKSADTARREGR